ncbi:unnamed protein product [Orchesella dallaii]|uniref:DNA-binding protein Ets97D n=1 Tax=Orchesella dallaii TaxID=48710 RepID=A0ABP1QX31_9HEXA
MMEFERYGTYRPPGLFPIKRELEMERDMECTAEDLTLPSKKKARKVITSNSPHHAAEEKTKNSRLPEGTLLKTGVLTQVMDIQEPLSTLRDLLEKKLGVELNGYQTWLQDKFRMQTQSSLGDQCIQSEGLAQVKVELKQVAGYNRINIIDVLRHPEESVEDDEDGSVEDLSVSSSTESQNGTTLDNGQTKWSIYEDINSLFPIQMPSNLAEWTDVHVHQWLRWATKEFKIERVADPFWKLTGRQLCQMTPEEYRSLVPDDPYNTFWTHIELLRKCHIFAVVDKNNQQSESPTPVTQVKTPKVPVRKPRTPSSSSSSSKFVLSDGSANIPRRPAMTGHNGQIQLWQFLLELLGDKARRSVIQWVGTEGEFKLIDPELVAQMWGERKNKPKMNYEKLSRALRYYYHDGMIAKVHGRRFVYKFECKLKDLIGYSTEELVAMSENDVKED